MEFTQLWLIADKSIKNKEQYNNQIKQRNTDWALSFTDIQGDKRECGWVLWQSRGKTRE